MSLLRFLGIGDAAKGRGNEPESLIKIGARLDALPPEEARFVAAFTYLLARIAGADLRTDDVEREAIARHLEDFAEVDHDRAQLLADTAIHAAATHDATDDHLVARAFREMTEMPERIRLLRCLYVVAAADDTITGIEDNEIFEVAETIGVRRTDVIRVRMEFKEHLGSRRALPSEQ